jgi:hypothetical protein
MTTLLVLAFYAFVVVAKSGMSHKLDRMAAGDWSDFRQVYVWVPIVLYMAWGLMKTNYDRYRSIEDKCAGLEVEKNNKRKGRDIRDRLGEFLVQGQNLRQRCMNESEPPPKGEVDAWAEETENFLISEYGTSYVARFRDHAGLPMVATSLTSGAHVNLWSGLHTRTARLQQFIAEQKD